MSPNSNSDKRHGKSKQKKNQFGIHE
uniref:Uncharacterized protein n=1 Tax=Rhizophora mucronata TaxID=61149 RepID=A0A2P2PC21_RHIMU